MFEARDIELTNNRLRFKVFRDKEELAKISKVGLVSQLSGFTKFDIEVYVEREVRNQEKLYMKSQSVIEKQKKLAETVSVFDKETIGISSIPSLIKFSAVIDGEDICITGTTKGKLTIDDNEIGYIDGAVDVTIPYTKQEDLSVTVTNGFEVTAATLIVQDEKIEELETPQDSQEDPTSVQDEKIEEA